MASFNEYRRRSVVPLILAGLAAFYLLVFLPLDHKAKNLDEPLQKAWNRLATSLDKSNSPALDFSFVTNQFFETRQSLAKLSEATQEASARLELPGALQSRLTSPFQLVEYQNELSKEMDELDRRAKQQKVAVDPMVFAGFPEYTAAVEDPALLWAALFFTESVLDTAVRCQVESIHSLDVGLSLTNAPLSSPASRWAELPIRVEFSASAASAAAVIKSLPLRPNEIKAATLPECATNKVPLLVDRLIIRKEKPEKLDDVRVWIQVVGFVKRD